MSRTIRLQQISGSGATDGQVVKYNSSTGQWEAANESGGGGSSTFASESFRVPDPFSLVEVSEKLPSEAQVAEFAHNTPIVISGNIYLFGHGEGRVMSASVDDPKVWTISASGTMTVNGETVNSLNCDPLIIGNKVYGYGYQGSSTSWNNIIITASVNDLTDWGDSGSTFPGDRRGPFSAIIGEKIYLYGGNPGDLSTTHTSILTASLSDPLTVTSASDVFPDAALSTGTAAFFITSDGVYFCGGYNFPGTAGNEIGPNPPLANIIRRAPLSDPTNFETLSGFRFPTSSSNGYGNGARNPSTPLIIDNKIYFTTWLNTTVTGKQNFNNWAYAHIDTPWDWKYTEFQIPFPSGKGARTSVVYVDKNALYLLGGFSGSLGTAGNGYSNLIFTSSYNAPAATTAASQSKFDGAPGAYERSGKPVYLSQQQKLGHLPWLADYSRPGRE